jgi:precorrin-2 methylase
METLNPVMDGLASKVKPPKKVKDMRKHGIARTIIEHNHDGSHQIEHHHIDMRREPSKHGAEHLEALHDHLEELLGGKPSKEELEAD